MNNKILYINFNTGALVNSQLGQYVGFPEIIYGSAPVWEIHLIASSGSGGTPVAADVTDAVAWHAAIDVDFSQSTTPMVRTLDPEIDHSGAASGIIKVPLNAYTETFLQKVDNKQGVRAYFELRGLDSNDNTVYCWQIAINALGAVDAEGGEPIPVASGGVTLSDVYAVVRQTPLLQYSDDGASWHDTQVLSDLYARVSVSGGNWSDSILLPSGAQGPSGEPGTSVTGVIINTLPDTSPATASLEDEILSLGIPSGRPGADGSIITGAVATTLSAGELATASYTDNTLYFGIPSGFQGPKGDPGQDGSAITGVVVNTLPDTAQASASFTDGLLSFGIPSGTPGEDGNPDAVTAVDTLPTASAATNGKAYTVKSTGHTWVGTSQTTTTTTEVQVYPNGYKVLETVSGSELPYLSAGTVFTSGGTYTAADSNTYTWYSAQGTNGHTYYLANAYSTNYNKVVLFLADNLAPSSWTNDSVFGNGWVPYDWYSGGKTIENIASLTTWWYHDDGDYGNKTIKFGKAIPEGAAQKVTLNGFSTNNYNGQYTATGNTVSVTNPNGTWNVPVYSNGTSYIFAANNPMDSSVLCWAVGSSTSNPSYYTSKSFGYGSDMGVDMESETNGQWFTGMYSIYETITASATYWQTETVETTTYSFSDITPTTPASPNVDVVWVTSGTVALDTGHMYLIGNNGVVSGTVPSNIPSGYFGTCTLWVNDTMTCYPSGSFYDYNRNHLSQLTAGTYRINWTAVSIFGESTSYLGIVEKILKGPNE